VAAAAVLIVVVVLVAGGGNGETAAAAGGGTAVTAQARSQVADMLKYAPEGTWATIIIDVEKMAESALFKSVQQATGAPAPDPKDTKVKAVVYVLPPAGGAPLGDNPPDWSAAAWAEGVTQENVDDELPAGAGSTTVAGYEAYTVPAGPQTVLMTAVEDGLLLLGSTEDTLTAVIDRYKSGQAATLDEKVPALAAIYAGDAVSAGFTIPDDVRKAMSADAPDTEAAQALLGLDGVAVGLAVTDALELKAMLRLGSAGDAKTLKAEAESGIAEALKAMKDPATAQQMGPMAMMAEPITNILESISFSADGADLSASAKMTQQDVMSLAQIAMSMAPMFMGGMGGPGMGAPGMGGPPTGMP
jgi:hypothetical protein